MRTKEHARATLRGFCQRPSPHRSPRNGCAQIRCHVSGKQHRHHDSSHAVDGRSGPASCVRLLDCIIPPMAVLFGRVPFNLSAKRIAGMLNCILSDSVCCVFILFHQEFQALPLSHSSKMPPSPGPITTRPSSKRAVWEKGFPRHVWVACLVPWVPHRSRRPHSEMLTGHTEQELLTLPLPTSSALGDGKRTFLDESVVQGEAGRYPRVSLPVCPGTPENKPKKGWQPSPQDLHGPPLPSKPFFLPLAQRLLLL